MFCSLVFFFLVFPVFVLLPASFFSTRYLIFPPLGYSLQWYQAFFGDPAWIRSVLVSLEIALLTAFLATTIGGLAAIGLVRGDFPGKDIISLFLFSPQFVPVILFAVGEFFILGALGIKGDVVGYVLVYTMLALPIVLIVISSRLQSFDVSLEEAARNLGANRWQALLKVTVPVIAPAIFTAALFAFNIAFEETVIAIFISKPGLYTLPLRMFNVMIEDASLIIAAVSSLQVVVTISLLGSAALLGRSRS